MPPLRAGVSHGESADDSGLCSSDRDSECGHGIVEGKTWTTLGSISKPWDELDRTLEDQNERRWADERRTSNAENEVEGKLVRGDGHGENRLEASTNEEDGWTLAEEHEDILDDVAFAMATGTKTLLCSSRKTRFTPCWPWTPTTLRQTTRW